MATDALTRLQKEWLDPKYKDMTGEELALRAFGSKGSPLKGSMIADVMEYGRMVHAEMNAITDAARSRQSVQDSTLYSTTMPCHLCTKLIVSSGIKRVVYVQPYPKSLVYELYPDSVSVDGMNCDGKVIFETLKGVTPNGYKIAFKQSNPRKNQDGSIIDWDPLSSAPTFISYYPHYRPLEITSAQEVSIALNNLAVAIAERAEKARGGRSKNKI